MFPIHTNSPVSFKKEFEKEGLTNVNLWEDGKEYYLWIIRKNNKTNPAIFALDRIADMLNLKTIMRKPLRSRTVPTTQLRTFYEILSKKIDFSTKTQTNILDDLLRKQNYNNLVNLFNDSYAHIERKYDNRGEAILDRPTRNGPTNRKGTPQVISILLKSKPSVVSSDSKFNFEYINREVSPLRTTEADWDTGLSARNSGTGGIDFIGWNIADDVPILGEVKADKDENPFYALIQLLTYLSEISTPMQIKRINKHPLFGKHTLPADSKFYLYILSSRLKKPNRRYDLMLPKTKLLAKKITGKIKQIKEIEFLHLDLKTGQITLD